MFTAINPPLRAFWYGEREKVPVLILGLQFDEESGFFQEPDEEVVALITTGWETKSVQLAELTIEDPWVAENP